jgi:hypothetical protein
MADPKAKHQEILDTSESAPVKIKGLTMLEASDLVKSMEEAFGVSASAATVIANQMQEKLAMAEVSGESKDKALRESFFESGEEYYRPAWLNRKPMTDDEANSSLRDALNIAVKDYVQERRRLGFG